MQPPKQRAFTIFKRFKQEIDYKYNGLYIIRYRKKLIYSITQSLIILTLLVISLIFRYLVPKNGLKG